MYSQYILYYNNTNSVSLDSSLERLHLEIKQFLKLCRCLHYLQNNDGRQDGVTVYSYPDQQEDRQTVRPVSSMSSQLAMNSRLPGTSSCGPAVHLAACCIILRLWLKNHLVLERQQYGVSSEATQVTYPWFRPKLSGFLAYGTVACSGPGAHWMS